MVRSIIASIAVLCALSSAHAQEGRAGLLLGTGAIAPAYIPDQKLSTSYLVGSLSYYMEDRISLRGRAAWYVASEESEQLLKDHHPITVGPLYHWGKDRLDIHSGFETGVSFTRLPGIPLADNSMDVPGGKLRVLPVFGLNAGLTFFVWDHFHFFLDLRYQQVRYEGAPQGTLGLGELSVGGGLGFQLDTRP